VIGSGWVGETAARPETTTPGLSTLQFNLGEIYANPGGDAADARRRRRSTSSSG
jgi:predicted phage gp36 major capsid-like protein